MVHNLPPMGWNTWNTFAENINEELVLQSADALIASGLHDVGYEYVVIDDCWALRERGTDGRLVPDPKKFPHGMKYVADYIHKKGLKFGMYSCAGTLTCAGYPSSYNYEFIDAATFAEWGVDYLKYDYCYKPQHIPGEVLYRRMGLALANCGRDILFSACSWGADKTHEWIATTGANMWRSTGDIFDTWESVKTLIKAQENILPYGGKDCYNDMDMLIVDMHGKGHVGLQGCTEDEYKLHFATWCLLSSPLMIGCDIRALSAAGKKILTNPVLIGINQDARACRPYMKGSNDALIAVRHLGNGDVAVGFLNLNDQPCTMFISLDELAIPTLQGVEVEITPAFETSDCKVVNQTLLSTVPTHAADVVRLRLKTPR